MVEGPNYHATALVLAELPCCKGWEMPHCFLLFTSDNLSILALISPEKAPRVYLNHRARGESPGYSSTGTWLAGKNRSQPWSKWQPRPGSKSQCKQEPHVAVSGDLQLLLEQRRINKRSFPSFFPLSVCSVAIVHVPSRAAGWLYGTRVSSANIVLKMNSVRWKDHFSLLTFSTA